MLWWLFDQNYTLPKVKCEQRGKGTATFQKPRKKYQQTSWIHISFSCLEIFETKLMFRESSKVNDVKKNMLHSVILNPYQQSSWTQLLFMPWRIFDQNHILLNFKCEHCGKGFATFQNPRRTYRQNSWTYIFFSKLEDSVTQIIF